MKELIENFNQLLEYDYVDHIDNDFVQYELIHEVKLTYDELKSLNLNGYMLIEEQLDIEIDGLNNIQDGYYNIYYFAKIF